MNESINQSINRRGLRKWWSRKLQFSDRQLQISNRGAYGCSKFQPCP